MNYSNVGKFLTCFYVFNASRNNTKRRAGRAGGPCCQMKNMNFPLAGELHRRGAGRLHYRNGRWVAH